jgi:DNA-binding MarR family transcriptional regulator
MSTLQTSSPTVLLTRLAWSTFRRLKPELLGMKLKEYFALRQLSDDGHMSQASLCSGMNVDANYMTLMLNDLEDAGYVIRKRDPEDRRRHIVELTDAGRAAIAKAEQAMDELEDDVLGPLDAGDREALRDLLVRAAG